MGREIEHAVLVQRRGKQGTFGRASAGQDGARLRAELRANRAHFGGGVRQRRQGAQQRRIGRTAGLTGGSQRIERLSLIDATTLEACSRASHTRDRKCKPLRSFPSSGGWKISNGLKDLGLVLLAS